MDKRKKIYRPIIEPELEPEKIQNLRESTHSHNFLQPSIIILPKYCNPVKENWLILEVLGFLLYGIEKGDTNRIRLEDMTFLSSCGSKQTITQFVGEYEYHYSLILYFKKAEYGSFHTNLFQMSRCERDLEKKFANNCGKQLNPINSAFNQKTPPGIADFDNNLNEAESKSRTEVINSKAISFTLLSKDKNGPEQSPVDFRFENINQEKLPFKSCYSTIMDGIWEKDDKKTLGTDHQFTHIQIDLSASRLCPCCGESYPFPKVLLCPNCYSWQCRECSHKRLPHTANQLCPKCSSPDLEVSIEKKYVVDMMEKLRREYENDVKKQSRMIS